MRFREAYRELTHFTETGSILRECKDCGTTYPLNREHFRPRNKDSHVYCYRCRECERRFRGADREYRRRTGNSLSDPNERITSEYLPEWADDLEIAALRAAEEAGVSFANDDEWEDFVRHLSRRARPQRLEDRASMQALATELLAERPSSMSTVLDLAGLAAVARSGARNMPDAASR